MLLQRKGFPQEGDIVLCTVTIIYYNSVFAKLDIYDNKLKMARAFGATHLINSRKNDVKDEILKIVGSQGADVTVDNTGNVEVIQLAYEMTQPQVIVNDILPFARKNIWWHPYSKKVYDGLKGIVEALYGTNMKMIMTGWKNLLKIVGRYFTVE